MIDPEVFEAKVDVAWRGTNKMVDALLATFRESWPREDVELPRRAVLMAQILSEVCGSEDVLAGVAGVLFVRLMEAELERSA